MNYIIKATLPNGHFYTIETDERLRALQLYAAFRRNEWRDISIEAKGKIYKAHEVELIP